MKDINKSNSYDQPSICSCYNLFRYTFFHSDLVALHHGVNFRLLIRLYRWICPGLIRIKQTKSKRGLLNL